MWNTRGRKHRETLHHDIQQQAIQPRNLSLNSLFHHFSKFTRFPKEIRVCPLVFFVVVWGEWSPCTICGGASTHISKTQRHGPVWEGRSEECVFIMDKKNRPHGFSSGFLFANLFFLEGAHNVIFFPSFAGDDGIWTYFYILYIIYRYIFLQVFFFSRLKGWNTTTTRCCSESWGESIRNRKLPQYIRRVCRFVIFCFLGIQWGCKVKIWKKLRGRSFLELPNLSWSNLPLPGSTGSSEGLVGSTPNFFGACRFFFF